MVNNFYFFTAREFDWKNTQKFDKYKGDQVYGNLHRSYE